MTEKDESVKSNSEYTEEQEVKNEDTSTVENVEDTTSDSDNSSNDSSNEESSEETAVDPKDEEIQQLQLKANENEEKYLGACSYDCAKHERNRYVARHHISNEEWQRRLNNFKDVPEHTHA